MSETPLRNIRVSDELWARIATAASANGESAASFIRRAVIQALKEQES